ncbi:MAG TPA: deoxyribose-phosphate aldolase [Firmicutes bacterium]|nr:deoxyribose-phosphate aldolase [Bacillota bacterium]HBL69096.1 deoxyribose-phosphate aldolase [Bacillota bacterium]HCM17363.1 deoxyribose-phosphate aldolase [Bacillota bacterium]HCT36105.1 deoxyribose-phosphate aldolase [Bacillota bacterium]
MANSYFDKELAGIIDHTLLKPEATPADIRKLCQEAREYQFCSVCVNPVFVPLAKQELAGSPVKVCTVIGFPLGATSAFAKAAEARDAAAMGADELDMVIRIGALKSGLYQEVHRDIAAVVDASGGRLVKVIIETALLTDEEKKTACKIAVEAGANFVKTSTGFSRGGATVEDVKLMRAMVGSEIGVKASGGIRDRETALRMVEAGASRLGLSAGVAVVTGSAGQSSY